MCAWLKDKHLVEACRERSRDFIRTHWFVFILDLYSIDELYFEVWRYISVKIQFSNLECKHAIRNAECQSMNPEMSFREVRIQSGNADSIPECNLSVEKASQSCDSSIHQVKKVKAESQNRIRNVNALRLLKFWRGILCYGSSLAKIKIISIR